MRKVIKISGKIFAAAVLSFVVLPMLLSLLLSIPSIQNFVVQKATRAISSRLETTVSIDRVDIGIFDRVKVYGFYVEDYGADTLLYVGKLDALITRFGIFGNAFTLQRGRVADVKCCLREMPDGVMNIKQVVQRLSGRKKEKKGDFVLSISALAVENLEFRLEKREHRDPAYGIDFGDMCIDVSDALIDNFTIEGASIGAQIGRFAARERSGFVLNDFGGRFFLTNGCLGLEQARIVTPRSHIEIPNISLVGDSWSDFREYVDRVSMNVEIRRSTLATSDLAYFAPGLRDWDLAVSDIDLVFDGAVSDFKGTLNGARFGRSSSVRAEGRVRGLPDVKNTHIDVTVDRIDTEAADVARIARSVSRDSLSARVLHMIEHSGAIRIRGDLCGRYDAFDAHAQVETSAGAADLDLEIAAQQPGRRKVKGRASLKEFDMGRLLGSPRLGRVSAQAGIEGITGKKYIDAAVNGAVTGFEFNDYRYDSIRLRGRLTDKEFDGFVTSRDENLDFDFAGIAGFDPVAPRYDFRFDLRRADLAELHINRRDSVSVLSARMSARTTGRSLDDMNGEVILSDGFYRYNADTLRVRTVRIQGRNDAQHKYLSLSSDFADATFRSRTSYRSALAYLKASLRKYVPTLYDAEEAKDRSVQATGAVDDYSLLTVDVKRITPLADAVSNGLQVADGSQLRLLFNPANDKLSLNASSEYVEHNRMLATMVNLNATNQGDSLSVYLRSDDLFVGAFHMPQLSVMAGSRNDRMRLSAGFNDTTNRVSALLGLEAQLQGGSGGGRVLDIRLKPSHISRRDKTWQIRARRILADTAGVRIDRFRIFNDRQDLSVDGFASRRSDDSVRIALRNFDLSPFTQAVAEMGYEIEGVTNGEALIRSALGDCEITADIRMDRIAVNDRPVVPLRFTSMWDFRNNRARLTVTDRDRRDTLVRGFYAPKTVRYYAEARLPGLSVSLLDPLLKGVISGTEGSADASLTLSGQRRQAELEGTIRVRGFRTTVDYTRVTYSAPTVDIAVKDNRLSIRDLTVSDPAGNRGNLDFRLDLSHLSNITYDLDMKLQKMLVLNTNQQDNDYFYGRVHASGSARIRGDKKGVKMDIVATTDDDSSFFLPLSSKSNISQANFVTIETPKQPVDTLNYLVRKKMMFERKQKVKNVSAGSLEIDMALNVRPNADFQLVIDPIVGDIIKGRGEGRLNLRLNPAANIFEMYGDYTIAEGSYLFTLQNIINKRFIIENGSTIQWTGEPLDALLDIDAVYKLKTSLQPLIGSSVSTGGDALGRAVPVDCIINLSGRLTNPNVTFDIKVPTVDAEYQTAVANTLNTQSAIATQFMFLLVTNSFQSETGSSGSGIGVSASAATGFELLSNQLSNWLSSDDYNIVFRYRPKSELTGDEVDFGFSKSLINDRLFVEVEGNYLIDSKQQNVGNGQMSNFMGEAYVTWLIDRSGTLKLKCFTQTIDRFDENQGLQETGIGIYYKEHFDNLKDLKQRLKDKFVNHRRRARRAERAERKPSSGVNDANMGQNKLK